MGRGLVGVKSSTVVPVDREQFTLFELCSIFCALVEVQGEKCKVRL